MFCFQVAQYFSFLLFVFIYLFFEIYSDPAELLFLSGKPVMASRKKEKDVPRKRRRSGGILVIYCISLPRIILTYIFYLPTMIFVCFEC